MSLNVVHHEPNEVEDSGEEETEEETDSGEEEETDEEETDSGEEEEEYVGPPRFRRTIRASANPARRIVFEEHNQQPETRISSGNVVEIVDEEGGDDRIRGGGGGEASSSSNRNESESDDGCCPICMEAWSSEGVHQISCLPCGHVYGFSCIQRWIEQNKRNAKCPQCGKKCVMKDIIKLYISRILVTDGEQQKKLMSLQTENEFLKMKITNLQDKLCQDKKGNIFNEEANGLETISSGVFHCRTPQCAPECSAWIGESQGQRQSGHTLDSRFGTQGSPSCSLQLEEELVVDGARILDIDASNQILILARRLPGMGGDHVLTKISLVYPYESENIQLPPNTKAVKDVRVSPSSDRLALFASLGKKLSVLSTESNHIVLSYDLLVPAWSCSWDLNSPHHLYAGLQNGALLVFDMRQTARPMESIEGVTSNPIHTLHSLVHKFPTPSGIRSVLSASSVGPCVWNTGGLRERPFVVPGTENQGVCISLAHCPLNDDIIASFRPKVQASSDIPSSQYSPSMSRGVLGSHIIINRVDASNYLNLASIPANVSNIRLPKSAIISIDNCNPLFAYGDEATNGLSLRELPSLRVVQCFRPHQNPILDVKYATSIGRSILGCTSEDRLQIFSARIS